MAQRHSPSFPRSAIFAAVGCVVVLAAVIAVRSRSADSAGPSVSGMPSAASSGAASLDALLAGSGSNDPVANASQPRGQILAKTSLADAVAVARPFMANVAGRLDTGSALLALWAAEHLTWDALESLPETSPSLFRKDPDAERGKRFCITGSIVEIRAEKTLASRLAEDRPFPLIDKPASAAGMDTTIGLPSPADSASPPGLLGLAPSGFPAEDWQVGNGGKVYLAVLKEKGESPADSAAAREARRSSMKVPLVVEIIAVRSSGTLVDGSDARACGVLTGVTAPPANAAGSMMDATEHRVVGMFDLPENHGNGEIAHHGG